MKRKQTLFQDKEKALQNPLRLRLLELIEEGVNNVNDMAKVLGTNKLNLYHHLNILEKWGFIKGSFGKERIKTYQLTTENESKSTQDETNAQIVISILPNDENRGEITELINKIITLSGGEGISNEKRLLQISIIYEDRKIYQNQKQVIQELTIKKKRAKEN